jgi:hypothetical protein
MMGNIDKAALRYQPKKLTNIDVGRSRGGSMTPPANRAAMIAEASVRAKA